MHLSCESKAYIFLRITVVILYVLSNHVVANKTFTTITTITLPIIKWHF